MKKSACPLAAVLRAFVLAGSLFALLVVCPSPGLAWDSPGLSGGAYLGNLSANPYSPNSIASPFGAGNPYRPNGVLNPYGPYGNPYSPKSWSSPHATEAPLLFNGQGEYRGTLSVNPYASDSISNPYSGDVGAETTCRFHTERGLSKIPAVGDVPECCAPTRTGGSGQRVPSSRSALCRGGGPSHT